MTQSNQESAIQERDTKRLEAFSDGVFAIAITLLVLNIHVPDTHEKGDLGRLLGEQWPTYLAFLLSFLTILNLWVRHHEIFKLITRTDHWLLFINGLLLLGVVILPFPTALVAQYFQSSDQFIATAVYATTFTYIGLTYYVLWAFAATKMRLLDTRLDAKKIQRLGLRYLTNVPFYFVALALLFWMPAGTLIVYFLLMLFYMLPDISATDPLSLYRKG